MKASLICGLMVLLCMPLHANAQAYKCKQANGRVSFQDQPCDNGAAGAMIDLPRSAPPPVQAPESDQRKAWTKVHPGSKQSPQDQLRDSQRRREDADIKARNDQVEAYNKSVRCNAARQQLGVAKAQRPIYSNDNDGNRKYVDDKDREGLIAAAERRVAEDCR